MIKILIVDDQLMVRANLQAILTKQPDFQVIGTAADGFIALEQVKISAPDIVLLDIEMPGLNGLEVAKLIHHDFEDTKVIIISNYDDTEYVQKSLQSGVNGYVTKHHINSTIVEIVRSVQLGHTQFGPGLLEKALVGSDTLAFQEPTASELIIPVEAYPSEDLATTSSSELAPTPSQDLAMFNSETSFGLVKTTSLTQLTDWSGAAKEVIDGVPLPWTRGLFYCLLAFVGVFIPWASFFRMDEIGTAKGRLELIGDTIKREANVDGSVVVTKVLVKKGDTVKKGQAIMELDTKGIRDQVQQNQLKLDGQQQRLNQLSLINNQLSIAISTQQQQNQAQLLEKQAQIAQAEQNLTNLRNSYNTQDGEKKAQLNQAEQTVQDRRGGLNMQKQEKITQINQAKRNIMDSTAAYQVAVNRLRDAQAEARRFNQLYKSGAISEVKSREVESLAKERNQAKLQAEANLQQAKLRYREQQNSYSKLVQEVQASVQQSKLRLTEQQGTYQRTVSQLKSDIAQAQLRFVEQQRSLQSLVQGGRLAISKSEQQLKEVQSQVTMLRNDIEQTKNQSKILNRQLFGRTIRADVDGRIFELPITREGSVIQSKQLIAEIAPQTNQAMNLVFKGDIPAAQSESLRTVTDKNVKLKFEEFPFEKYGIVNGKLTWISPNSKAVASPVGNVINYEVRVALAQPCLQYRSECIPFKSGQPATAEIVIRKRRIIDLITAPFKKLKSDQTN
jgi:hemolysin D